MRAIDAVGRTSMVTVACLWAPVALSQHTLTAADGKTAIVPVRSGFLSFDFTDEKVSMRRYWEEQVSAVSAGTTKVCGLDWQNIPDHTEWDITMSAAAKDGKQQLFSNGRFVPSVDASVGWARFFERPYSPGFDCSKAKQPDGSIAVDPEGAGYETVFVSVQGSAVTRRIANASSSSPSQITKEDKTGGGVSISAGYNRAFGKGGVLGLAVTGERRWVSPGDDDPQDLCVVTAAGTDSDGQVARIESCEERYLGPLRNENVGQVRLDYVRRFGRIGGDSGDAKGPFAGILAATSVNFRTSQNAALDFAVGPTIHPADKPSQLRGAVLVEFKDITNANGKHPKFGDKFSIRLYATVPF